MEKNTSETILNHFDSPRPDRIKKINKTGLLFTFKGGRSDKSVLLRSELDALPIQEVNNFEYRSITDGISHKCGHDGHMTMLTGFGEWCSENRLNTTDIHILFQPAEETGQGAREILENDGFDLDPDYSFAIHNIPGYAENNILLKENHFSASVISIDIGLKGKTSHAGEPEKGINPGIAVSEIIQVFDKFNQQDPSKDDFFITTPVFIDLGERAFGTSAGNARLGFTFRCWDNELMKENQGRIRDILDEIARLNKLEVDYEWLEEFYANNNDPEAIEIVRDSAERLNYPVQQLDRPFKWGEDFGFFTSKFKGAMIGLGSGLNTPALHNPDYDFPDEIIETGVNLYKEIVTSIDKK